MEKLLETYSISEIVIFLVIFSIAVKGVVTFFDWAVDRLRKVFDKEYKTKEIHQKLAQKSADNNEHIQKLTEQQEQLTQTLAELAEKVNLLIESDRDDIKSFLTREHHFFCYQKGWIDDYSLECCERRYGHYVKEDGNSFICGFMEDLRALPKQPPQI